MHVLSLLAKRKLIRLMFTLAMHILPHIIYICITNMPCMETILLIFIFVHPKIIII